MRNSIISWGAEFWRFIFCSCFGYKYEDDIEEARTRDSRYQNTYYSPLTSQTEKKSSWSPDRSDRQWKSNTSPSHNSTPFLSSVSKSNASSSSFLSKPVLTSTKTDSLSYKFITDHISPPLAQPEKSTSSSSASNSFSKASVPSQGLNYYSPLVKQTETKTFGNSNASSPTILSSITRSTSSPTILSSITRSNASSPTILSSITRSNASTISPDPLPSRNSNASFPTILSSVTRSNISTISPEPLTSRNSNVSSPRILSSVTRSNASTISPEPLSSHLIWKPSSRPSAQPHVPTSPSTSMSFSKASVTSPSSPSNDSKSPKRDQKGAIHRYEIPKHIQELIKNDIVPPVLKKPVSPSTYSDYFSTFLYAEDFYCEKWSDYLLEDVTLELRSKESYFRNHSGNKNNNQNSNKNKNKNKNRKKYSKIKKNNYFVTFEIDDVPERRPYLLSRDHVHLRPSGKGKNFEPFKGVIYRVSETKTVLTEFQDDFHRQHKESNKYDVSFSFNRVCLKRAHRAVSATTNPLLLQILFPNPKVSNPNTYINNLGQFSLINRILKHKGPTPYLIEGPLSDAINGNLTSMGNMIKETIFQIYKNINGSRVLICAPRNRTCDAFMRGIMEKVDKDELFRANAAFRDIDFVPDDIRQTSLYKDECFTCPMLPKLQSFRIITSTFISTYRLYEAGIGSGHFTHIFLVDASSWVEPEIIVSLTDFVSEDATLVVTGSQRDEPIWIRSDIGRKNGLRKSLFKRLLEREPYCSDDPTFVTRITENV